MRACNSTRKELHLDDEVVTIESPSRIDTDCTIHVYRKAPNKIKYCGVRLDFIDFRSSSADQDGQCVNDSISFYGSATVESGFTTCGTLTGQHGRAIMISRVLLR